MRNFKHVFRLLLCVGLLTALACPSTWAVNGGCPQDKPTGDTDILKPPCGPVRGLDVTTSDDKKAEAYLGIPFAEPLGPETRWTDPAAKKPWTETYEATELCANCPQLDSKKEVCGAEDCLYINVWRPAASDKRLRPVMMFIYGGGFTTGGSGKACGSSENKPMYDGAFMAADKNVVVVTFNYRLGSLGFLAYKEGTDDLEGNYGFLDQQLALNWVKTNISAFGGDPGNVTLFGESAGAMSVGLHMGSAPDSKNLFRTAIMESNPYALPYKTLAEARNLGQTYATKYLKCDGVDCMRGKSLKEILTTQDSMAATLPLSLEKLEDMLIWTPVLDGKVITSQPVEAKADLPVLLGANQSEGDLFTAAIPAWLIAMEYKKLVLGLFGEENGNKILKQERYKVHPLQWSKTKASLNNLISDYMFHCGTQHVAENARDACYAYEYTHHWSNDFGIAWLAICESAPTHACELPFVWNSAPDHFSKDEKTLSLDMMTYWTNMGWNGQPNGEGPPHWPQFSPGMQYQILDTPTVHPQPNPYEAICPFWDEIGYDLSAQFWTHVSGEMEKNYKRSLKKKK